MSLSFWFILSSEGTLQVPEHIVNNLPFLPRVISTGFLLITRERERGKKIVHVFIRRQGIHVDIGLHVCIYIYNVMYSCSWNSFIMKKSLSLCVNETERKEEKNKSSLCLGVGSLCCFDSTPSRIFLLSLSAYSRQEALPAITSSRHYANIIFRRGVLGSLQRPALKRCYSCTGCTAGPCSTSPIY